MNTSRGFTLIEAMVALLVLSIGLLGVAGLQLNGLRSNISASWRSQATYLAYDIIDRMRANRDNSAAYVVDIGVKPTDLTSVAARDLYDWKSNIDAVLPGGDGAVAVNGQVVTITLQWNDTHGNPLSGTEGTDSTEEALKFVMETRT